MRAGGASGRPTERAPLGAANRESAMRTMALDVGEKTVGSGVTDELGISASPRETLRRDGSELDRLERIVKEEGVGEVVVGLPISLNGTLGPSAQKVLAFVETLRTRLEVPIE